MLYQLSYRSMLIVSGTALLTSARPDFLPLPQRPMRAFTGIKLVRDKGFEPLLHIWKTYVLAVEH